MHTRQLPHLTNRRCAVFQSPPHPPGRYGAPRAVATLPPPVSRRAPPCVLLPPCAAPPRPSHAHSILPARRPPSRCVRRDRALALALVSRPPCWLHRARAYERCRNRRCGVPPPPCPPPLPPLCSWRAAPATVLRSTRSGRTLIMQGARRGETRVVALFIRTHDARDGRAHLDTTARRARHIAPASAAKSMRPSVRPSVRVRLACGRLLRRRVCSLSHAPAPRDDR